MLGGIQGFHEGFRFGREMVEGTEDERRTRLAAEAARNELAGKAMAERRKATIDAVKFEELKNYHAGLQDNANRGLNVQEGNLGLNQQRYVEAGPQRQATLENTNLRGDQTAQEVDIQSQHEQWRKEAQGQQDELNSVLEGKAAPELVSKWAPTLGLATQNAPEALAKINNLVASSRDLAKQGRLPEADALWGTSEGRDALNSAWGPLIRRPVGQVIDNGKYVIKEVTPTGLVRHPGENKLSMNLEVTRGPTPEYKKHLDEIIASSASPEEKSQAQRELQDSKYAAPLTSGRTPLGEGGTPRWFSPDEFAKGVNVIEKLAIAQEQDPKKFERLRGRVTAIASGKTRAEGNANLLRYDDKMLDNDAAAEDLKIRQARLKLSEGRANGGLAGKDDTLTRQRMQMSALKDLTKAPYSKNEDGEYKQDPVVLERYNRIRMKGYDIIRNSDGNTSLEEVMKKAKEGLPLPAAEIRSPVDGIAGFNGGAPSGGSHARPPRQTATSADGHKMFFNEDTDAWEPM